MARRCAFLAAVALALPVLSATTGAVAAPPTTAAVGPASVVPDAQSARDDVTAARIAHAHGHPVTVLGSTTETSQVQALPNGSFQLTVSSQPVRIRRGAGWVPVDSGLSLQAGSWCPRAAVIPVRFSAGGSGPLAQVQAPSGQWLTETWPAGPLPAPTVRNNTARYAEVLPGVDLVLTATSTGMSEVLVVKNAAAAANPELSDVTFGLNTGSLATSKQTGGSAVARSADGKAQLVSAAATWWDSSSAGASAAGPGGLGVPAPVSGSFSDTRVTVNAASVARQPTVRFPVYVDPTWTGQNIGWGFVDSAYPSTAYWKDAGASDGYQHVGYVDAAHSDDAHNHTTRSYWQMDVSGALGGTVSAAHFDTTETYSFSCSARTVNLWTASAASSSTTWNSNPVLSSKVASANVAYGYSSACPAHAVGFDATAAVGRAITSGSSVINLELVADSETDVYGWKKFAATATLTITYNKAPNAPSSFGFSQPPVPCSTGTGRPAMNNLYPINLQATLSDPDAGDTVYGTLQVLNLPMTQQYWTTQTGWTSSGSVVGFTIPANTMTDGTTFLAQSWATDNSGAVGPNSVHCEGVIDDTPPPLPTVALATGSSLPTKVGQSTQLTISSNPSDGVSRFLYWWAPGTNNGTPPAPVQTVGPNKPLPACGSYLAGVGTACPDATGAATVAVAPIDNNSTLWVTSIDGAGNVSTNAQGSATSTGWYPGPVAGDWALFETGQAWPTDKVTPPANPVAGTNGSQTDVLTLNATTSWATGQQINGSSANVLSFNGTSSAATAPHPVDLSKPFTVSAWVYPTGNGSRYYTAISTDSATTGSTSASGFDLQYYAGTSGQSNYNSWRFCLPNGTSSVDCATSAAGQVQLNQWTFVAGQWDPVNHAIRLYVSGALVSGASHQPATGNTGQFVAGRAWWAGATTDWWAGMIESPAITPSLSDSTELGNLMVAGPQGTSFFQCPQFGGGYQHCG